MAAVVSSCQRLITDLTEVTGSDLPMEPSKGPAYPGIGRASAFDGQDAVRSLFVVTALTADRPASLLQACPSSRRS